jgi:hypothetical protein
MVIISQRVMTTAAAATPPTPPPANHRPRVRPEQFFATWYRPIALLVGTAVFVGGYWFFLRPSLDQMSVMRRHDIDQLVAQQQYLKTYQADIEKMVSNFRAVNQTDIDKVRAILPDRKGVADLFVQFQTLAEQNGFVLESVTFGESGAVPAGQPAGQPAGAKPLPADSSIQRISASVVVRGAGYPELKQLLDAVERNLRLFDVNAVYFASDSPRMTLNIFTYYLPAER